MAEKLKTINIKGKDYVQVNDRLKAFRESAEFAGWSLTTDVRELTNDVCVMVASIADKSGRVIATGWAREVRTDTKSMVNATSYVENCETSAWGRALGNLGIGIDDAICSAQEVQYAINAQENKPAQTQRKSAGNVIVPKQLEIAAERKQTALTEREQEECDAAFAAMDNAESKDMLNAIYMRYKDANFAPLLLAHGNNVKKEKGW